MMELVLSLAGCALLFLGIWVSTLAMPWKRLALFFPQDVQERLQPRLDRLPMSPKRIVGWGMLFLLAAGYIALVWIGGMDGVRRGFNFQRFFLRFFIVGAAIKAFDIIALDYFLLTKTHFFQHYLPETEGCAGWQSFGYNRKQQLLQIALLPIVCVVLAKLFTALLP
ncbi:MAG: hypothetical protein IJ074_13140 [Clostridia bacterium]|nr:hypothetical protein [Clostridia bacterium]